MENPLLKLLGILVLIVIAIIVGSRGFCSEPIDAEKALATQGYSEITILEKNIYFINFKGCGRDDAVMYRARAKNAAGLMVELTACGGYPFKGFTIRTK